MSRLADELIHWYHNNKRDLPWRKPTTTAWGILVSEVMSQQTPVSRVEPQWTAWMRRWPTPAALADASTADVLRAWGRLGYPRRAVRLKECAETIVRKYDGEVPSSLESLQALPGVGTYTAAAVACFHFGHNVPVVDTNVRRVYARLIDAQPIAGPARASDLQAVATLLPEHDGPVFSVALMELGALVCRATTPLCGRCPVQHRCAWIQAGSPAPSEKQLKAKRTQRFAGTDRQVRGKIMAALRANAHPLPLEEIATVWPDNRSQFDRSLEGLVADGLVAARSRGRYGLPD